MEQPCGIPKPKHNEGLPQRLVIAISKQKGIVSRL